MPIPVMINRSNQNRKYNFNTADVRFLKSEIELSYLIEIWPTLYIVQFIFPS